MKNFEMKSNMKLDREEKMDELTKYYTLPLVEFLKNYRTKKGEFEIPLKIFVFRERATEIQAKYQIINLLEKAKNEKFEIFAYFDYNYSKIIIKELSYMRKSFYVEFPYMKREKYFPFLLKLEELISLDGMICLAVNNVPGYLKSAFIIECVDNEEDKVKKLLEEFNLTSRVDRGLEEVIRELKYKMWNIKGLPPYGKDELREAYRSMFFFSSNEELEKKGYKLEVELKRKQVFISYSHKDKNIVRTFADELRDTGINAFIDARSIDYGENILKSIMEGMEQSDLNIIFISNNYKESNYAKTELYNAFNGIIQRNSNWIIVKLDDVNPDDVIFGLGGYKYFEWENNSNELINVIKNKLRKI